MNARPWKIARAPRARPGALGWLVVLAPLAVACETPTFTWDSLPEDPIVFVYRTTEQAENVQDLLSERRKDRYKSYMDENVRLEDVARFLNLANTDQDRAISLLGRLAILHPVSRTRETLPFARKGARPLDWSADRRRLMLAMLQGRSSQLFEWDRDTGDVRPLTWGSPHNDGCYGPDGSIAFARIENATSRIYVRRPGEREVPVTPGPYDSEPTWSPDGKTLVYRSFRDRRTVLLSVDPDEPGEPDFLAVGQSPVFSPDGAWVVFVAKSRGTSKLFKMRPDGSGRRRLGESAWIELDPTVSPDGRFVAFVVEDSDRRSIWVRPMDGPGDLPLEVDGDGLLPLW